MYRMIIFLFNTSMIYIGIWTITKRESNPSKIKYSIRGGDNNEALFADNSRVVR